MQIVGRCWTFRIFLASAHRAHGEEGQLYICQLILLLLCFNHLYRDNYIFIKGIISRELYIYIKGQPYICLLVPLPPPPWLGPPVKTYSGRTFKVRTPISDAWMPSASSICKIFRMPPRYFCSSLCFSGDCLDFTKKKKLANVEDSAVCCFRNFSVCLHICQLLDLLWKFSFFE